MKVLSYVLTIIWGLVFFLLLGIFHPLQWIALKLFGYKGHKAVVDLLNLLLMKSLLILGSTVKYEGREEYPKGRSVIFVSNHQSMFDIPPMIWWLRKTHPKFVAKKELGKGIPSISFNLKHGGAALIDRKDKDSAIEVLKKFGKTIREKKWSAIIFPEGTRSRGAEQKKFSTGGLKTILAENRDALVVPVTIKNSWKLTKYGKFPMGLGARVTMKTHKAMEIGAESFDEFLAKVEQIIKTNGAPAAMA
jgi:1-acyl-sn-glycerol-3-phosphate acyltransferase